MNDFINISAQLQKNQNMGVLSKCNRISERFGLVLSETVMQHLTQQRMEVLKETGRVEFSEGILAKLVERFCDSPYLRQEEYEETLLALQELFYNYKNECQDLLSDDELLDALCLIYNEVSYGSVEFLSDIPLEEMYQVARTGTLAGTGLQRSPLEGVYDDEEE